VNEIGSLVAAGGAAAAAVARYRNTRPSTMTPGQRYLLVVLFGLAAALVLDAPTVESAVASYTNVPYLARLLSNLSAMAAAFAATAMVVWTTADAHGVNGAKQVRWCAGAGVLVGGMMVLLLLTTDAEFDPDLAAAMAGHHEIEVCQVAYWVYMAGCICRFVGLMRQYLSRPDIRALMHQGMVTVTMAGLFGVLWLVWNAFVVIVQRLGCRFTTDPLEVSRTLGAFSVCMVAAGLTLPLWTSRVRWLLDWWRTRRALYRLNPLWHMMTDLVPEAVAFEPELGEDLDLLLYRQVIEVRDAQLRLMPYVAPDVDELVARAEANLHEIDRSPVRLPAARLASAIANYRAGRRSAAEPRPGRPDAFCNDVHEEAEWLAAVYVAMTSDPIVAGVVSESGC
jgi:hypothetical protein